MQNTEKATHSLGSLFCDWAYMQKELFRLVAVLVRLTAINHAKLVGVVAIHIKSKANGIAIFLELGFVVTPFFAFNFHCAVAAAGVVQDFIL
jgi:hypothetical protein